LNRGVASASLALVACLAATSTRGAPIASSPATVGPVPDVAVLRPASDDAVLVEASTRLQLELGASGSTSALVDVAEGYPARVALVREDGVAVIDVLGTLADGGELHRRVPVPPDEGGDDPAVIAVRAVELLRGIRLGARRPPPAAAARAAVSPEPWPTSTDARGPEHVGWRLGAGLGVLSARPLGDALAAGPVLAASAGLWRHVSVAALFAGPFFTDRPATPQGSARTREELASLGFEAATLRPRWNVHGAAAVGFHHARAVYDDRGRPAGPRPELELLSAQSSWSPIVTVSGGASVRARRRLGASLELVAVITQPAIELVANGRALGTLGGPSLLTVLSAWIALP
jgi:hypothetical protein